MAVWRRDDSHHPVAHLHGAGVRDDATVRRPGEEGVGRDGGAKLHFGVVTGYPEEDPTSRSLLRACAALGTATALAPASIRVEVDGEEGIRLRFGPRPVEEFDVLLLLRGLGPGGDYDVQLLAYRLLEEEGHLVINSLDALLSARDKLRTSALLARAGVPTPPAAVVQQSGDLADAFARLGSQVIAKPQWGSLGEGIELLHDDDRGRARAAELLEDRGALYLQAFVDHGGRDLRLFVVGDRVEAAMERRAPPDEIRTNLQVGGVGRQIQPDRELREIAVRAARAIGLDWAGVDVAIGPAGPTVLEVNGSPGWEGIDRTTRRDMGEAIAWHAARRANESSGSGTRMEGG